MTDLLATTSSSQSTLKTWRLLPIKGAISTISSTASIKPQSLLSLLDLNPNPNIIHQTTKNMSIIKMIKGDDKEKANNLDEAREEKFEDDGSIMLMIGHQAKPSTKIPVTRNFDMLYKPKPIMVLYKHIQTSALGPQGNVNNSTIVGSEKEIKTGSTNTTMPNIETRNSQVYHETLNSNASRIIPTTSAYRINELNQSIYPKHNHSGSVGGTQPMVPEKKIVYSNSIPRSLPNLRAKKHIDDRDSPSKSLTKIKNIKNACDIKIQDIAAGSSLPNTKRRLKPKVTAKSWSITDGDTGEFLYGKKERELREIASLTKIMTCLVTIKWIKKLKKDPQTMMVKVSTMAASMIGTTANLKAGDELSIYDLLHGLMLPSGNDAAYCLAENMGHYIYNSLDEYNEKVNKCQNEKDNRISNPLKYFVREMNHLAKEYGLCDTIYANPHGLIHKHNRSTAADIGKLCCMAMKDELVRQIVCKKSYVTNIRSTKSYYTREIIWENTNKLLYDDFEGIKTGITSTAGPCLAASKRKNNKHLIVVILNSKSSEQRWKEVKKLMKWAFQANECS